MSDLFQTITLIVQIIQTAELPFVIFGGVFVFRKIAKSKEVKEWITLIKALLEELREHNRNGRKT